MNDFLMPPGPRFDSLEDAIAAAQKMAEGAKTAETMKCIEGEPVFYMPYDRALVPGHIYSEDGIHEMQKISKCCEYHFDKMFEPGWTDPVTGEPGMMPPEED